MDGKTGGDSLDVSRKWGTNTPPDSLPYYDSCDPLRLLILCPLWFLQPTPLPYVNERTGAAGSPPGPRSTASTRRDALPERMCVFFLAHDSLGGGHDSSCAYYACLQRPRLGQTTLRSLETHRASPHYNFVTPKNQNSLSINMEVAWAEMVAVAGASVLLLIGGEGR